MNGAIRPREILQSELSNSLITHRSLRRETKQSPDSCVAKIVVEFKKTDAIKKLKWG
jgi:hypothetical protein